ncbi:MAG TPA: hypothetical protein P5233_17510 [Candidatus Paceibacterota bacterium]|nr:hypothetical protein [Candidatus Paceibacterota bacterium]
MIEIKVGKWQAEFDERQQRLIKNCEDYALSDPAGVPGHNLMLIVAKMSLMLDKMELASALNKVKTSDG